MIRSLRRLHRFDNRYVAATATAVAWIMMFARRLFWFGGNQLEFAVAVIAFVAPNGAYGDGAGHCAVTF